MEGYEKYIKAWQRRVRERKIAEKETAEKAYKHAIECAKLLVEKFGAQKVYLFGSLVDGRFHLRSDIDLAVEGLEPRLYFKALSKVYDLSGGFEVDLVPLEDCKFRETVLREGKLLYAKQAKSEVHKAQSNP
ncbi:nucleotidyltransferase domain-containing protein [Candidatus Poribacteria bacterium]|nr:nucleotidyltransferase domain-containing protein [Candidatus Poribacteria bacterium]